MSKDLVEYQIEGAGGGSDSGTPYVPIEAENTLQSKDIYRVIELISEGEIEGLIDGQKSIFVNDVPLQNEGGSYNYEGVTLYTRLGALDQSAISGFPSIETPVMVGIDLTVAVGTVTQVVTDSNVDAVYICVTVGALYEQKDNGDLVGTTVSFTIQINSGTVVTKTIKGKCMSPYRAVYRIALPHGEEPWSIKLTRITPDSETVKLVNTTQWTSYTELIDHKIEYRNSALVAAELDAALFGNQIPVRSYRIRGLKILTPTGYTPPYKNSSDVWVAAVYPETWDGTFQSARYTSNPAWVLYDLLTNTVYGAGLTDPGSALKWALYPIAQRCDELISDGVGGNEPRYTINCVLNNQQEAYALINEIVAMFHGLSWWGPGTVMVSQDAPLTPQILATPANVIGGEFVYEGSGLKGRYTVCLVTWNDPANHCKPAIEPVTDSESLLKYGYKPIEIAPLGCTSRGFAHRLGRWVLDTAKTATQMVTYVAGLDHAFVVPGSIIAVADPFYANVVIGGRIKSVVTTTVTLDRAVTLSAGETYNLWVTLPDGTLESKAVTTASDGLTHSVLTIISAFSDTPQVDSVWSLAGTDVTHRFFTCLSNTETVIDGGVAYTITGLFYDPNKFARIEDDIELEDPNYSLHVSTGTILPPNNADLLLKNYYADGQLRNMLVFTWERAIDDRVVSYNVQFKAGEDSNWEFVKNTPEFLVELTAIQNLHYYFRVQSVTRTGATSSWVYDDLDIVTDAMPDVTGLVLLDGASATEFKGGSAKFTWDTVSVADVPNAGGVDLWFRSYIIEIWKSDTLVRTDYPAVNQYEYSFEQNTIDGGPDRTFTIKVYQLGNLGQISNTPATLEVTNPAPSMSGFTPTLTDVFKGIQIDWSAWSTTDLDITKIQVFLDTNSPPTTLVETSHPAATGITVTGLEVGTEYNVRLLPWDEFGPGVYSSADSATPLILAGVDVDLELTESIAMTDGDGNSAATLAKLYDRNTTSDGVSYTLSGVVKLIDYAYAIVNYIDKVIIHTADANAQVYIATSSDAATWSWFKAEADHTLTASGEMVAASSQADAATNYLQLEAGLNAITLPQRVTAKNCRLYMVGTGYTTEIYELVFIREVIAEQVVADNLSSISANIGTVVTGYMQSEDYTTDAGVKFDLDNSELHLGGSDGGVSEEGMSFVPGDGMNIVGSITNTDPVTGDYGQFTAGGLTFYFADGLGNFFPYKSVKKILPGVASNGVLFTVPGYWRSAPQIMPSMQGMPVYKAAYSTVDQRMDFAVDTPTQVTTGKWQTRIYAKLNTAAGVFQRTYADIIASKTDASSVSYPTTWYYTTVNSAAQTTPASTISVTVSLSMLWSFLYYWFLNYKASVEVYAYINGVKYILYTKMFDGGDYYPNGGTINKTLSKTVTLSAGSYSVYVGAKVGLYDALWGSENHYSTVTLSNIKATGNIGASSTLATGSVFYIAFGED